MASYRIDRISEEVRHVMDGLIRGLNDPRIDGTWSITRAEVTRDLRYAKIYVSILEDERADGFMKALKNAAGYLRRELGRQIDLRYIPELLFERDRNIAYGIHISQVLNSLNITEEPDENIPESTVD